MTDAKTATKTSPLPARQHLDGCPAPPERIEAFTTDGPGGRRFRTTRCITCGGQFTEPIAPARRAPVDGQAQEELGAR